VYQPPHPVELLLRAHVRVLEQPLEVVLFDGVEELRRLARLLASRTADPRARTLADGRSDLGGRDLGGDLLVALAGLLAHEGVVLFLRLFQGDLHRLRARAQAAPPTPPLDVHAVGPVVLLDELGVVDLVGAAFLEEEGDGFDELHEASLAKGAS